MNINELFTTQEEEVLKKNESWFKFYLWAPIVLPAILAVLFFFTGLILAVVIDAIFLVYFWILGGLYCLLLFVIMRISASHKILHIYYLKKITLKQPTQEKVAQVDEFDDLPLI